MSHSSTTPTLKLGLTPKTIDKRDLKMSRYSVAALTQAPVGFGHQHLVTKWGMLGNDQYGDCAFAGSAHETMLWCKCAGTTISFTPARVLSDYAACTGFDPKTGNRDNGTDLRELMRYRQHTGIIDTKSKRHKIAAYVWPKANDWTQLLEALYAFEVVGIGIQFPSTAMDQFNRGEPWDVVKRASIEGGHYIPVVARPDENTLAVVTWGKVQLMTRAFFEKYCDQACAPLSTECLNGQGKTLEGLDLAKLQQDLAAL